MSVNSALCHGTVSPEVTDSDLEEEYSDAFANATPSAAPISPYRRNRRSLSEGNILFLDDDKRMQPNLRDRADSDDEATEWRHEDDSIVKDMKRLARPSQFIASTDNLQGHTKFISNAEAIYKFHRDTPKRFRSQPRLTTFHSNPNLAHLKVTVPHSPMLRTKIRTRPCHIMTKEQREQMEFEEIQKIKFKAKPVNKNLHNPSKSVPIERKPVTKPEPFKLTCPPPKKIIPKQQFVFQALPIPRTIYLPPLLPEVEKRPVTDPETPMFMKNYKPQKKEATKKVTGTSTTVVPTRTVPAPFSFENRDNMRLRKREQLIKKMMDEERQGREFRATPMPRSLFKKERTLKSDSSSSTSSGKRCPSTDNICPQFKAREATVLKKSPFIPSLPNRPATIIVPFQLETESRRVEREEFDRKMKLREEELEQQKQRIKEMQAEQEQQEREKYRKLAEYKANPIKKYKPVEIQLSKKVTNPVTPLLHQKKSGKDKENVDKKNN
ncbi:unnamed protein product [Ceutorhynchus assimilis]|uniref:Targeting protein for Xklp2 n=1 Tax=Ceutorhynchus assimilis TaxID=467358 RepID=A0A9N9Q8Z6_9CUCU|nr:unnamed protein product [Ceutorhynchus assimilis]